MSFLTPGQVFAQRYRIDRFIAEGGMGAVYAGTHLTTEMRVAVKVLRPALLSSAAAERQFQLEAKVAARVQSEHIVKVFDAGKDEESGLPFLVMELLEGQSLEHLVERAGALPPQTVVQYLEQVAMGLDRAHGYVDAEGKAQPIVHRDLKPENIFVSGADTPSPRVKILDFGIAKVLSDTAAVSQELRGTPLYMAYEQVCGQPVSPQTDVWALGLIAFYALTGRNYWKTPSLPDATIASLLAEITTQPTPPASERGRELHVARTLPPSFDAWLARCLKRDPSQRFSSSGWAVAELSQALAVLPFAHTVDSQSNPPLDSAFPSTLQSAASPMGSTTGQLSISSSDPAQRTGRGRSKSWWVGGAFLAILFAVMTYVALNDDGTAPAAPASAGLAADELAPQEPALLGAASSSPVVDVPPAEVTPPSQPLEEQPPPPKAAGEPRPSEPVGARQPPAPATHEASPHVRPKSKPAPAPAPASGSPAPDPYQER